MVISRGVFPFFVCCGRSGSTLLRSMFDSHPELAVPGESYFITELLPQRASYEVGDFDTSRFIDHVMRVNWTSRPDEPTWIDRWGIDRELLRETVISARPESYTHAVRAVFACYADWKGKPLYGDKTPAYITRMDEIADLLPEARFVHLVRDGRNVALARLDAPFGPRTIEEIALHWRARVLAGREAGRRLGPDRYIELRYEELVSSPQEVLPGICSWLGLPYHPQMLDHRKSVKELDLPFGNAHQGVMNPVRRGMRDWRSQMSASDLEIFELIAGDALDAFGYERRGGERLRSRVAVELRLLFLEGKKHFRRFRGLKSAEWW